MDITRHLAYSLLRRFNMVKREGTKAARKLLEHLAEVSEQFLGRIIACVEGYTIPPCLVIN